MIKKKILSIFISICLILSVMPTAILADFSKDDNEKEEYDNVIGEIGGYLSGNISTVKNLHKDRFFNIPNGGLGFAAEQGNNQADIWSGKNARVVGGDNVKNGADRVIIDKNGNHIFIQDKYYSKAIESVNAAFDDNGKFRYFDSDGKPMKIEVPSDQYDDAVEIMRKKIKDGKLEGFKDPNDATKIIKKGKLSYKQALNLTKAGNIDSLKYDAKNGIVSTSYAMGISFVIDYVLSSHNGSNFDESLRTASMNSLKNGATIFATHVISSQIAKTGAKNALKPTSQAIAKALGPKVSQSILTTFTGNATKATGATLTNKVADIKSNSMIVDAVLLTVLTVDDVADAFDGKISSEQLIKNLSVALVGIGAGTAGSWIGGGIGSSILPGAGTTVGSVLGATVIGGVASLATEKIIGIFYEEDAEKMFKILSEQFTIFSEEFLINTREAEFLVNKLQQKLEGETLKEMHASEDREKFANDLMNPMFEEQIKSRKHLKSPTEEDVRDNLKDQLKGIIFIH